MKKYRQEMYIFVMAAITFLGMVSLAAFLFFYAMWDLFHG